MNGISLRQHAAVLLAPLCAAIVIAFLIIPAAAHAQANSQDLGGAIRAALLSDSRSAQMSPEQFDALVASLAAEATKQGMTSRDITQNVVAPLSAVASEEAVCDSYLCSLNNAFGFSGSNMLIPIGLGFSSALLLLIIGVMKGMHRHPIPAKS